FNFREILHQHHRIGIQVLLHHSAVTDGAFLVAHGAQAECHRALGLHGHLLRVDGVTAVDRDDDPMNLELAALIHRDLCRTRAITRVAHELGDATIYSRRGRTSPANAIRHGIEHGKMLWAVCEKLASKLQRIFARGACRLIDKRLKPDPVLVCVHPPPEAHGNVRVAYGMLDEEVGDRVAKARLSASAIETLKRSGVSTISIEPIWRGAREDGWGRNAHVQADEVAFIVEASREFAQTDRPVAALTHVLFAAPDHLDGNAGNLFGDQDSLRRIVLPAATAKA